MATLLVLEWSRPAEQHAEYMAMLREECEWDAYFCFSSGMVPGFGLVDEEGNPTDEYWSFQAATGGGQTLTAIDERAAQLGAEKLGEPLSEEIAMDGGVKIKGFYNGILIEVPAAGVYAVAEATVAHLFRPAPA